MEDYDPYVATAMGAFRQPCPASPQERHVRPRASDLMYPGEELEPYIDDDLPPGPDFTRPEEANLVTPIIQAPPQEDNADIIWGPLDEQTDQFPVEFHPFLYLQSDKRLEEELLERYGLRVKQWQYKEPHLTLIFTERDRVCRALESQKLVAHFYPSEPSAYAQRYEEGSYQPWSPAASAQIVKVLSARIRRQLELCPIPQPISTKGSPARPPGTNFKSANLTLLFHPNGSPQIQGLSQSLMLRYLIPPQDFLTLLTK
jgi:hypothetical protein